MEVNERHESNSSVQLDVSCSRQEVMLKCLKSSGELEHWTRLSARKVAAQGKSWGGGGCLSLELAGSPGTVSQPQKG